jgi:ribosomal protein L31E
MRRLNEGNAVKLYKAIIWKRDSDKPGERVTVDAENLKEAKEKLESQYGEGTVFDLHNEEDAARPR